VTFGADMFVAVDSGAPQVSTDGVLWTENVSPTSHSLYGVTSSADGTRFVAVGDSAVIATDVPLTVSVASTTVFEGNGASSNAQFDVALSRTSSQTVTVAYSTADGTAIAGADYQAVSGTVEFPPGSTHQAILVPVLGDLLNESSPRTFVADLANPTNAALGNAQGLGSIVDDDPLPTLSVTDVAVEEPTSGTASATFTVTLSAPSALPVTVAYGTEDGSAQVGLDYVAASGSLSFAPGEISATLVVPVLPSAVPEGTETFLLTLSAPTQASLGKSRGQGWILPHGSGPRVQWSAASYMVKEVTGQALVKLMRTGSTLAPTTVTFEAAGGNATAGSDFIATTGSVTFAPGQTVASLRVSLLGDSVMEGNETVLLSLAEPIGGLLGEPSIAVMTIQDNDAAGKVQFSPTAYSVAEAGLATITVTRTGGLSSGVTVDYTTSAGTATAALDYTPISGTLSFAAGVKSQKFTIPVLDDAVIEGHETVSLTLSNPTGGVVIGPGTATLTIQEGNPVLQFSSNTYVVSESAPSATITVTRSGLLSVPASVEFVTSDGTAVGGADYQSTAGTLSFGSGVSSKTVSVPLVKDALREANPTVLLTLFDPSPGAALGQRSTAVLTLLDDDPAGALAFSLAGYSATETAGSAVITVRRTGGTAAGVTVGYATSGGTAQAGVHYGATSGTLTFGAGVVSQIFTVPVLNDVALGPDRTVNLVLSSPTGGATLAAPQSAVLTLVSADAVVGFSAATYTVSEAGTTALITVKRSGPLTDTVTADFALSDGTATEGSDYVASTGTLIFGPNVATQTLSVGILDDTASEGDESVDLQLVGVSPNAALGRSAAVLTIAEDEPKVQFSAASYAVAEAKKVATVTVKRSGSPAGTVTVNYATSDGTATAGVHYLPAAGTLSFGPGVVSKTFAVTVIDDALDGSNVTINLALSSPVGAQIGGSGLSFITVGDNDVAGKVQFKVADYSVSENGPAAIITVVRAGGSAAGATVDFTTSDGSAIAGTNYDPASGTLMFGAGETSKTIEVTVRDDGLAGGNRWLSLMLANPGGGASLGGRSLARLWIVDNR
jgi:hypothetical protein